MADDDPVTDTRAVTDPSRVTGTRVADTSGVTKPTPKAQQNANAKPKIAYLFIYDDDELSDLHAKALHAAYHAGATMVGLNDWNQLVARLSRYSEIGTLVLFTHSIPGQLLLGGEAPTTAESRKRLAGTGVTVTKAVVFEGCSIMQNPVMVSTIFGAIAAKGAQLRGYTLFSVMDAFTVTAPQGVTEAQLRAQIRPNERYLLPGQPTAKAMLAKPGTYTLVRRWFRKELDTTPAPPLQPDDLPQRGFTPYDKLGRRTIKTADEAKAAVADFKSPVPPAEIVTVTDIAAAASAVEP